jgi:hypothetical protein
VRCQSQARAFGSHEACLLCSQKRALIAMIEIGLLKANEIECFGQFVIQLVKCTSRW